MKIALCLVQTNFIFYQKDKVIFQEYGYITLNELNHNASGWKLKQWVGVGNIYPYILI